MTKQTAEGFCRFSAFQRQYLAKGLKESPQPYTLVTPGPVINWQLGIWCAGVVLFLFTTVTPTAKIRENTRVTRPLQSTGILILFHSL